MKPSDRNCPRLELAALNWAALVLLPLAACAQSAMPSTETLERVAKEAYEKFKDDRTGKNADYIPALAKVPSNLFGITIATSSGQLINVGDVNYPFSMQSCSKVFTMCLVMQESGDKAIYDKVSVEPTGKSGGAYKLNYEPLHLPEKKVASQESKAV